MRLLLDSNIILFLAQQESEKLGVKIRLLLENEANDTFVSAASLWEIAIKTRLGKLDPGIPLAEMPGFISTLGFFILPINETHALEELNEPPVTRDPFDRLLLAQCQLEGLRLVTVDRSLDHHPLAWRVS